MSHHSMSLAFSLAQGIPDSSYNFHAESMTLPSLLRPCLLLVEMVLRSQDLGYRLFEVSLIADSAHSLSVYVCIYAHM